MSTQLRTRALGPRRLAGLLLLPLLVGVAGCSTAAGSSVPTAARPDASAASHGRASGALVAPGAPAQAPVTTSVGTPGSGGTGVAGSEVGSSDTGIAGSAPAIAYPYPVYPGSPGVAPDHTIVVTGIGRADIKADLSDQPSAQRDALQAALADAKAQSDVVARAAGVTIVGVLSVSVSSGESYAVPLAAGAAGSAPGATQGGPITVGPAPFPVEPSAPQLMVTVTVAYRIN